jgi:hypothetical protein
MSRKSVTLTPREINKINLLWFLNQWNVTNIAKTMKRSPAICERNIFKSRDEWYKWSDQMVLEGKL